MVPVSAPVIRAPGLSMRLTSIFLIVSMMLAPVASLAQAPGVSPPPPVESAPLAPPSNLPQPAPSPASPATPAASVPPPAVATPAPAPQTPTTPVPGSPAPTATARPTLVPGSGDPVDVDDVVLPGKPAAILSGTSTWDDGFTSLKNAFRKIEEELTRAAIAPAGRPIAVFLQTDDLGFRYDAIIPVPPELEGRRPLSPEVRFGKTPEGKALRFVHKEAYDEIDETYETITAYLDAKNVTVKDMFIEEYVTDLTESTDTSLEINIFVQPQ
jgi:effector-binding domain-containing protein